MAAHIESSCCKTHFGQNQLDLDGAHGHIHGPCITSCISANIAWGSMLVLWILYHKLSLIMLIRRSAGPFKCYFQIFENFEKFEHGGI